MMRHPSFVPTRQRGVALIMAVLIVALATILAISVASEGYMDQRRTSTAIVLDQAFEVALGAEAAAAYVLSQDNNQKADTPDEAWATRLPPQVIDEGVGEFTGYLEDLQGRFNLNNVLNKDGSRNPHGVRQFQNLLDHLKIDPKYATRMLDWIDADNIPDPQDGAEDAVYAAQTPAYLTANMVITRTSELMSIFEMTPQEYLRLEPYIAALPVGTPLNVCTASAEVIDSLDERGTNDYSGNLEVFAKNRSSSAGCFPSRSNLTSSWSGTNHKNFTDMMATNPDALAEITSFFRANIVVTIGTTELALYSTLYRATPGANGKTRVIQRSIGTT